MTKYVYFIHATIISDTLLVEALYVTEHRIDSGDNYNKMKQFMVDRYYEGKPEQEATTDDIHVKTLTFLHEVSSEI